MTIIVSQSIDLWWGGDGRLESAVDVASCRCTSDHNFADVSIECRPAKQNGTFFKFISSQWLGLASATHQGCLKTDDGPSILR